MRATLMTLALLPYLYFAAKDNSFHFKGRKVTRTEHLLHAIIGLLLIVAIGNAYVDRQVVFMAGMVLFIVGGSVDEFLYHREIPGEESDLHAKEHLALFIFVVVTLTTSWLAARQWQLAEFWAQKG